MTDGVNTIVNVTDTEGGTYEIGVPQPGGQCFYRPMPDGSVIVVVRITKEMAKPRFVLAPAVTAPEVLALRKALTEAATVFED